MQLTPMIGVDYAEYFPAEEILTPGQLVGINVQSGKTRAYRNGDTFLGIISTKPGVVGGWTRDIKTHNLVGLMGQLPFSRVETHVKKGKVYTKDQKLIGTLLSTGDIYLNGFSGDDSKPLIKEMEKLRNINKALEERLNIQENKILDLRKKTELYFTKAQIVIVKGEKKLSGAACIILIFMRQSFLSGMQ